MSLTEKLKRTGRRLALTGMLGSSLYISGCEALILGVAIRGAAEVQADAIRDAARIQSQQNKEKVIYVKDGKTYASREAMERIIRFGENKLEDKFFVCNNFKGDLNNNEIEDPNEYEGYNKEKYTAAELVSIIGFIYNRAGAKLSIRVLDPEISSG